MDFLAFHAPIDIVEKSSIGFVPQKNCDRAKCGNRPGCAGRTSAATANWAVPVVCAQSADPKSADAKFAGLGAAPHAHRLGGVDTRAVHHFVNTHGANLSTQRSK